MPLQNTCMRPEINDRNPTSPESYGITLNLILEPEAKALGRLEAISVETGKTLWKFEQRAGMFSVVTTAGNLVFAGDTDRRFRAFDATTGKVLWEVIFNGPVTGHPISFSIDGIQYIAVTAGGGDRFSGVLNSLVGLKSPRGVNMLYVFPLPRRVESRDQMTAASWQASSSEVEHCKPQAPVFTKSQMERGEAAYAKYCVNCHMPNFRGGLAQN